MTWEHAGHEINVTETATRIWYTRWAENGALRPYDSETGDGESDYKADCRTCEKYGLDMPDEIELDFG